MSHAAERHIETSYPKKTLEIRARRFDHAQPQLVNLLTPQVQGRLRGIATPVEFPRGGDVIFNEGDRVSHIYFIASGMVRISRYAASGRRQVIAFMLPVMLLSDLSGASRSSPALVGSSILIDTRSA